MEAIKIKALPDVEIKVIPFEQYDFLVSSRDVCNAFGLRVIDRVYELRDTIAELKEGVHYVRGSVVQKELDRTGQRMPPQELQSRQYLWTRAGIIRLGFILSSDRARAFRQWAESFIAPNLLETELDAGGCELSPELVAAAYSKICQVKDDTLRKGLALAFNRIINAKCK